MIKSRFLGMLPLRQVQPPPARMAQGPWVQIDPKVEFRPDISVQAPLNIELGGLPLTLGLFGGSALALFIRGQVSKGWPKTTALLAGTALGAAGILNLVLPRIAKASTATAAPGAPALPGPSSPGGIATEGGSYSGSEVYAFESITGRVTYPSEGQQVDLSPFASSYQLRIQLYNSTNSPASFQIDVTTRETPSPAGDEQSQTIPVQVSVGAGQIRDIDVAIPLMTWGAFVDYIDVDVLVGKRRIPGENPQMLASRFFVIE